MNKTCFGCGLDGALHLTAIQPAEREQRHQPHKARQHNERAKTEWNQIRDREEGITIQLLIQFKCRRQTRSELG